MVHMSHSVALLNDQRRCLQYGYIAPGSISFFNNVACDHTFSIHIFKYHNMSVEYENTI